MATTTTYGTLSASEHSANLRKAVIASTIGTTIEWYDFFIYGTAAGLICISLGLSAGRLAPRYLATTAIGSAVRRR